MAICIGNRVRCNAYGDNGIEGIVKGVFDYSRGTCYLVDIGGEVIARSEYELTLL